MGLIHVVRNMTNIQPGIAEVQDITTEIPVGGILLDLRATWIPRTYTNLGTTSELITPGDILLFVQDTSGFSAISQNPADYLVVRSNSGVEWGNEYRDVLFQAESVVAKLWFRNESDHVPGLLQGGLRLIASLDPIRPNQVQHDLVIEANVLTFDLTSL